MIDWSVEPSTICLEVGLEAGTKIGTTAQLRPSDKILLSDLLYGLMLPSGNDAAQTIADGLGHMIYQKRPRPIKKFEKLGSKNSIWQKFFIREMNN